MRKNRTKRRVLDGIASSSVRQTHSSDRASRMLKAAALTLIGTSLLVVIILDGSVPSLSIVAALLVSAAVFLSESLLAVSGRRPILSMRPLVGLLGLYMLVFGPVSVILLGPWLKYVEVPANLSDVLEIHIVVTAFGAAIYKAVVVLVDDPPLAQTSAPHRWSGSHFWALWRVLVITSLAVYGYLLAQVGLGAMWLGDRSALGSQTVGLGPVVFVADWLPILLGAGVAVAAREKLIERRNVILLQVMVVVILVVVSGWRGSRGSVVLPLVTLAVLWTLLNGPIRKHLVLMGVVLSGLLLVAGGYFKLGGVDVISGIASGRINVADLNERSGRGLESVLRGDLDRTSAQALLLSRIAMSSTTEPALGATYIGAPLSLVPDAWIPGTAANPNRGVIYTGILLNQERKYVRAQTSRSFGMQGEGYINFGLLGGAAVFAPFALIVGAMSRGYRKAAATKSRAYALAVASFVAPCLVMLPFELDVALSYFVKISLPFLLLALAGATRHVLKWRPVT